MEKLCKRWRETGQWLRLNARKRLFVGKTLYASFLDLMWLSISLIFLSEMLFKTYVSMHIWLDFCIDVEDGLICSVFITHIVHAWIFLVGLKFWLVVFVQSQEEVIRKNLTLFWKVIMIQYLEARNLVLGERKGLKKQITMQLSPQKLLTMKVLLFLQFSEERFASMFSFSLCGTSNGGNTFMCFTKSWFLHFPCRSQKA